MGVVAAISGDIDAALLSSPSLGRREQKRHSNTSDP
jgi:hypothetical protein